MKKVILAFGRFWFDFFIGDTPELFIAMLVLAGLTAALVALSLSGVAVVALPTLVIAAVALSVRREQRKFR